MPVPSDRLTHGAVSIALVRMAGAVTFWNGSDPVAGTTLNLVTGGAPRTTASAADGSFAFENLAGGAWSLTPVKSDEVRGISGLDASLVLRSRVGTVTLSEAAALAADIDEADGVTELDASAILRVSTEMATLPITANGHVWRFLPAALALQHFWRIHWARTSPLYCWAMSRAVGPSPRRRPTRQARLPHSPWMSAPPLAAREELIFTLTPTGAPVYSLDLALHYDSGQIEVLGAQAVQAPGQMAATNVDEPGIVRLSLASSTPLPAGATVATVRVRSAGDARAGLQNIEAFADERPVQVLGGAPANFHIFLPILGR